MACHSEYDSGMAEGRQESGVDVGGEGSVRLNRTLADEEFKANLEMTKAFCDTAKGYVQISAAGLAVPLILSQAIHGEGQGKTALADIPWSLLGCWAMFLVSICCGLLYQWLAVRRLWDQYHGGHRTIENMNEPGYRLSKGVMQTGSLNLSWIWMGMTLGLALGALSFVIYSAELIANRVG
jgi:hypothetical protein